MNLETIAVYWEKQVKVYGIILKEELNLLQLKLAERENFPYHSILTMLERQPITFELLTTTPEEVEATLLSVIVSSDQYTPFIEILQQREDKNETIKVLTTQKVEIIYLHGPHFQERFGILARATEPLYTSGVTTVATGCAGNSMYIVVPKGQGKNATAVLHDTFQIPA